MPNAQELIRALMEADQRQRIPGRFEPEYAGASDIMQNPAMAGLNEMDPAGAQGRNNAQGMGLAGMGGAAYPALTYSAQKLIDALSSTPAGAAEPTPQAAAQKNDRLSQLDALISEQIQKKNAALKAAETQNQSSERYKGDDGKYHVKRGTTTVKPTEEEAKRLGEPFDKLIANYQKERESLLPWMQTAPAWERSLVEHAPEISAVSGGAAGLLNKNPLAAMLWGGFGSLGEGAVAATYPTVRDTFLPDNSPAGILARKNIDDPQWRRSVVMDIGEAGLLGTVGAKFGNMGRKAVGQAATGIGNALRGERAAPTQPWSWRGKTMTTNQPQPQVPQAPQAPVAPAPPQRPWNTPQVAPFGKGIGRGGAYYNPVPQGGAPPQAPLTPQELAILLRHAKK